MEGMHCKELGTGTIIKKKGKFAKVGKGGPIKKIEESDDVFSHGKVGTYTCLI